MKNYIPRSTKSEHIQSLINESLYILECVGIPLNSKSERGLERMAVCFLAVAGVTGDWKRAKGADDNYHLKTREIITIVNKSFQETISPGSYDDIRRKDLKLLVLADLVVNSGVKNGSATNDPTRGYALHPDFKNLIITFNTGLWKKTLIEFNSVKLPLSEILERKRNLEKIPVKLPNNIILELSLGEHNILQKVLIEEFLPRFGSDCNVLYIGDTSNKILHIEIEELKKLNFFELSHNELPDIIAYCNKNNWLYLIEAVHSSGPMSETRVFELKKILKNCKAELIFVTGFLTKQEFKKWMLDIAWETEVWIAENPDHLIHFNGHKFLGSY
jgi:hypothetical protein